MDIICFLQFLQYRYLIIQQTLFVFLIRANFLALFLFPDLSGNKITKYARLPYELRVRRLGKRVCKYEADAAQEHQGYGGEDHHTCSSISAPHPL